MLLPHTLVYALSCLLLSANLPGVQSNTNTDTALSVLTKVNQALANLTAIQYEYVRELHYPSEAYRHESRITTYLEFNPTANSLGFLFQTESPETVQVYNGSELFELRKKNKTIQITPKAGYSSIEHQSFLYNSPLTLRNHLPVILADKAIPKTLSDTLLNDKRYHVISFKLQEKAMNNIEGYRELTAAGIVVTYQLMIDAATDLPVEVLQTNSLNSDYIKTSFVSLDTNPNTPIEGSWYFSTYLKEYSIAQAEPEPTPIAAGTVSPVWRLPLFGSTDSVGIGSNRGKVTLLEFWFRNCGYCIAAIPELNKLHSKYKGRNFQLFAVNVYDSPDAIGQFVSRNKPTYPTLYNGNAVALRYGLGSYPSVVLLDKHQRVLYAGDLDIEKLDRMIQASL